MIIVPNAINPKSSIYMLLFLIYFAGDYDNAVTFMNYYSEKPYGYDRVMGNAIY